MLANSLDIARSALKATAEQAATVSRNVANASNPLSSAKRANAVTSDNGGVFVSSITRAMNEAMSRSLLKANAEAAGTKSVIDAIARLAETVGDPELEASPAAVIGKLRDALQTYSASPANMTLAAAAVGAARQVATTLNEASQTVQTVRSEADAGLAKSVARVNELLASFETVNREIVKASVAGTDATDALDERDALLRSLSEEIGIKAVTRSNNDLALFTDSGLTLFDNVARNVTMAPSGVLAAGVAGNAVYIDNVPVTGPDAVLEAHSGRIHGLSQVRDVTAVSYQSQLDEMARGLITIFSESDQSAVPTLPDIPGLFTYPGAPAVPAAGTVVPGLAASIVVNPSVDPAAGGNPALLRDGAIGDPGNPAYIYNATGQAGFSDRVQSLIEAFSGDMAFDAASGLRSPDGILSASAASASWIEQVRQHATEESEYQSTLKQRAHDALSREIGVNLDEELASMLEIERAYQISSKLLSIVDQMLTKLVELA